MKIFANRKCAAYAAKKKSCGLFCILLQFKIVSRRIKGSRFEIISSVPLLEMEAIAGVFIIIFTIRNLDSFAKYRFGVRRHLETMRVPEFVPRIRTTTCFATSREWEHEGGYLRHLWWVGVELRRSDARSVTVFMFPSLRRARSSA